MSALKKHFHLIGMGGIGMSALARILLQRGATVSGSDCRDGEQLRSLSLLGAEAIVGHAEKSISSLPPSARVVCSSSIRFDNVERAAAAARGLSTCHRADILAELSLKKTTYGVSGSHGKSSTSGLLAWLLGGEEEVCFALGGMLKATKSNGQWREKGPFVVEIDESDGKSFAIELTGGILTSISPEHLNHWKSFERLCCGFADWTRSIKNQDLFVYCADDPLCCQIAKGGGFGYGFAPFAHFRISHVRRSNWSMHFDLHLPGSRIWKDLTLPLLGEHQVLNATAALALADLLHIDEGRLRERLAAFCGVCRRGELKRALKIGPHQLAHFDDYAHHPKEVNAFLRGLRSAIGDQPLTAVFQPHRYTRLRDCFEGYLESFDAPDCVFICPIYSAGEVPIEGIGAPQLARALALRASATTASNGKKNGRYLRSAHLWRNDEDNRALRSYLLRGGVLCTLGAGDIDQLSSRFFEGL